MSAAPALIAHGGAGARGPAKEHPARRVAMIKAVERGAAILRSGGSALEAVVAVVTMLEDDAHFNAGYGSALNAEGQVEMDASLMVYTPAGKAGRGRERRSAAGALQSDPGATTAGAARLCPARPANPAAGAVAALRRVRNPILLARAVMEKTGHVMLSGPAADRLAKRFGLELCHREDLIAPRSRERWRAFVRAGAQRRAGTGTVGAVAIDRRGQLAAATSTGGIGGKLPGRIGDSAVIGAGTYADCHGAGSATGLGEAIIITTLCREAVRALGRSDPARAAAAAIAALHERTGGQAGVILVDCSGRIGCAHNAESMELASFDSRHGIRHSRPSATVGA